MATGDIARRLSFGASKIGFPTDKYLSSLDDWELAESNLNFVKLSEGIDNNITQDLADLKEYFSKLKFNYLEIYTKQRFLANLSQDKEEWQLEQYDEKAESQHKKEYKVVKDKNSAITNEINNVTKNLVESYEQFSKERESLRIELDGAKQMIDAFEDDDDEQLLKKHKTNTPRRLGTVLSLAKQGGFISNARSVGSTAEWYSQLRSTLVQLSGLDVKHIQQDAIQVSFEHSSTEFTIEIRFKHNTTIIENAQVTPNVVPISDILDYAKDINDLSFLTREIRARVVHFASRQVEVDRLTRRKMIVNYESRESRVTITLQSGLMATMEMEADYPQAYAGVVVTKLDDPTQTLKQLESWKTELNRGNVSTLTQMVDKIAALAK